MARAGIAAALLCCTVAFGQTTRHRVGDRISCAGGTVLVTIDVFHSPADIDEMIRASKLIIEGTVTSALPPETTDSDNPGLVETYSIISIAKTLAEVNPGEATRIAIVQQGGKVGNCASVVNGDPLLKPGEHYIFFLIRETRDGLSERAGLPVYVPVGIWSGKAQIVDGRIQFLPRVTPGLHSLNGASAEDFITMIKSRLAR